MFTRRAALALAGFGAGSLLLGGRAYAAAGAPALAEFFEPPQATDVALSPDGTRISVLRTERKDGKVRSFIDILEASDPSKVRNTIPLGDREADYTEWANEERLLVWLTFDVSPKGKPGTIFSRRLFSVKDDGTKPALLFDNRNAALSWVGDMGRIIDLTLDDPKHVLMMSWDSAKARQALFRVNVENGDAHLIEHGDPRTFFWYVQDGQPMLRLDSDRRGRTVKVLARAPGEDDWKLVRKIRDDQTPDFFIVAPGDKPGVFTVGARLDGEDTVSLRDMDLTTVSFGPPKYVRPGRDATSGWFDERRRFVAATYVDDRISYDFADKSFDPHFQLIERHFGDEANIAFFDVDQAQTRFLAHVQGPRDPGRYILYDRNRKAVVELGVQRPGLARERLGRTEPLRVRTRDGAEITAYLTAPLGEAPGPLVVLAHGGPELRDHLGYDRQVQILAAQGWWVLQPNFRGSGGYGLAFAQAGWGRWGDRMQEDIEDSVAHAVALKKLDAGRVAITGSSYGGYAALMGVVRRPDLYRAAISSAGVSDLPAIMAWEKAEDDSPDKDLYGFWRRRIGDPATDKARLEAASPRLRAAEIKVPVLLIHGESDEIVPVAQSRAMAKALKAAGKPHEYIEVAKAGHGDWDEAKEQELMTRWVNFLQGAFRA
jgi:dipeptidyl aminopeptidase/acylaminoacyl peptidase